VVADENGDLSINLCGNMTQSTYTSVHISKTRHPRLQISDFVSYRFSAKISGGIYNGVYSVR